MTSTRERYQRIAPLYDLLDLPFEYRRYRQLRPLLFAGMGGLILDAGVGTASDASIAMELGADGVLMNTAIAEAAEAELMAEAMRDAVAAGRKAYLAGRMPKRLYASASSPFAGVVR